MVQEDFVKLAQVERQIVVVVKVTHVLLIVPTESIA